MKDIAMISTWFPSRSDEGLGALAGRIRRQPRELLWRRLLVDAAEMNRDALRHRALIVDSLLLLFEADSDAVLHQELGHLLSAWRWTDVARVVAGLRVVCPASRRRWIEADFLLAVADKVDDRAACLAAARQALDAIPAGPRARDPEDFALLEGGILLRHAPAEFLARFDALFAALMLGPFAGRALVSWLRDGKPAPDTAAVLRAALDKVPMQNRDDDDEVELASRDGLACLAANDTAGVLSALARMRSFLAGANFPVRHVLKLVRPLLKRRLHVEGCVQVLEGAAEKRNAEAVRRLLAEERRRR